MTKEELKNRTKKFALRIIKLVDTLPNTISGRAIGGQIIRSGASTAANYRAACRSRSMADFISKLCVVEEEVDETAFWLEIIIESGMVKRELIYPLLEEANEIVAIMVSSKKTARSNSSNK